MIKRYIPLAAFLALNSAFAQMPPTDVDLRAAYCIGMVNAMRPIIDSGLRSTINAERAAATSIQNKAERLRGYLLPRMQYMDEASILVAMAQGKRDITEAQKEIFDCTKECFPRGQVDIACANACNSQNETHLRKCDDISWLPY